MENEEVVLEKTRGRVKELTKVSDDRNNKGRQFSSCEAVLQYENTMWRFISVITINYYLYPTKQSWKAVLKVLQLAGHKEILP